LHLLICCCDIESVVLSIDEHLAWTAEAAFLWLVGRLKS
jgi:hypothetical protein